jgi:hypothetical protein
MSGDSVGVGRISQAKGVHKVEVEGETIYAVYNRQTKDVEEYEEPPFLILGDLVTFEHKGRTLKGEVVGFVSAGRSPLEAAKRQRLQGDYYQIRHLQIRGQLSYIISARYRDEVVLYVPKVSTIRKA